MGAGCTGRQTHFSEAEFVAAELEAETPSDEVLEEKKPSDNVPKVSEDISSSTSSVRISRHEIKRPDDFVDKKANPSYNDFGREEKQSSYVFHDYGKNKPSVTRVSKTEVKNGTVTTKTVVITRILKNEVDIDGFELFRSPTGKDLPKLDGKFLDWASDDDFLDHVPLGARAVGIHIPHVEVHKVKFDEVVSKRHSTDRGTESFVEKPDAPEAPDFDGKDEVEADNEFKMMVDPSPTKDEMAFFLSLNKARTEPKHFVKVIKEMLTHFNERDRTFLFPNEKVKLMTHEGRKAFDEAIKFLNKQKPLPPFELSTGMSLACRDLVADHGPRNMGGHVGSDRSTMDVRMNFYGTWHATCGENCGYGRKLGEQMVAQLIVDDGVPSRGHRDNIYKPEFHKVGIATGPHFSYGHMVVNDFAGDYYEDPSEKQTETHRNRLLYFFVHEDKRV